MPVHIKHNLKKLNCKRWIVFSILALCILSAYYTFSYNRAFIEIGLTTNVDEGYLQIYWAGNNEPFSEKRSEIVKIQGGQKRHYGWYLTDLGDVRRLRLDPLKKTGKVRLHYIYLYQEEMEPIKLVEDGLKQLTPVRDISEIDHTPTGLLVTSSGADPGLLWHLKPYVLPKTIVTEVLRFFCILAICWAIAVAVTQNGRFLLSLNPICLWIILGLIFCMAILSGYNKHPDEYVHTPAGLYYENKWLPPEICQPGTEITYSVYGVSRLNSKEVFYFLAGKVASLTSFLPILDYLRLRFVNILLFICILMLCYRYPKGQMLFIPLLVSPQLWYLFSYFNSDAFSLFVIFFICYQIIYEKSWLRKCWNEREDSGLIFFKAFVCGVMFCLIFFIKKNYLIMLVYFTGYFLIASGFSRNFDKLSWTKTTGFLAGGIFMGIIAVGPHIFVNGFGSDQKIMDCREKLANEAYKPSTPLDKKWTSSYLKKKGIPLSYVVKEMHWGTKIFRSLFGVYGYTTYTGTIWYYHTITVLVGIALLLIGGLIIFYGENSTRLLLVWTVLCALGLIGISLWRAWVADMQAQGRYLLPILPMIGMLMFKARKAVDKQMTYIVIGLLFLTSCYSFIFFGLKQIPKI